MRKLGKSVEKKSLIKIKGSLLSWLSIWRCQILHKGIRDDEGIFK